MIFAVPFFLWMLAEIAGFALVGQYVGAGTTVLLVIVTGIAGWTLLRYQGGTVMTRIQVAIAREEPPVAEMLDGVAIAIAGICLMIPGFISDILGILLFVPPLRRFLLMSTLKKLRSQSGVTTWARTKSGDTIIEGEYEDVTPHDDPTLPRQD
ncbi:MAG: hypothetical protein CMM50_03195 [Rhodospirillaceae bacterium]|nr:hypothetical protein [Rhodospirillaceae bacterium]|tara:strand:- start:600 stop:1058 length:459 start_codon:yes stop_codon:yes gene_type:complete